MRGTEAPCELGGFGSRAEAGSQQASVKFAQSELPTSTVVSAKHWTREGAAPQVCLLGAAKETVMYFP